MLTGKTASGVVIALVLVGAASGASLVDVHIIPPAPTEQDVLTVYASGFMPQDGGYVEQTDLVLLGTSVNLGLYFKYTYGIQLPTPWSYAQEIGSLNAGTYQLTVRTFGEVNPNLNDTFQTSFTVIPEPTSGSLLLGGLILARKLSSQRSRAMSPIEDGNNS